MTGSWEARYAAEFFGTLILVLLGNGAVANAFLKNTTGNDDPGRGLVTGGVGVRAGGYAASNDVRVNLWKPLEPCDYDWSSNGWSLPLVTRCAVLNLAISRCHRRTMLDSRTILATLPTND